MSRRTPVLFACLLCLAVAGCSDESPVIEEPKLLDELVIANCYTVRDSAEAYAVEHGNYPDAPIGRLENPYTNLPEVPHTGFALYPGETGYWPFYGMCCDLVIGYLITGYGAEGEVIALSNLPRDVFYFDEQVVANGLATQRAAEAFAADNHGEYPDNVDSEMNLLGNTLADYLPGGSLLKNPYTSAYTEPVDHIAATAGQTGYVPTVIDNFNYGYTITGFAENRIFVTLVPGTPEDFQTRSIAFALRAAVETFAAQNSGVHPDDVEKDSTPSGDTVLDLLSASAYYWMNRYTKEYTEPRNGLADERGQVGYIPMSRQAANDGYVINAWGLFGEIVRFEK
jgi:hypothetical protein